MDGDIARISEIPRPSELLPSEACQNFGDMAISCYFATHNKAQVVSVSDIEIICGKFGVCMEDVIGKAA